MITTLECCGYTRVEGVVATFYHDVVYDVIAVDNEERSAGVAMGLLKLLAVDEVSIYLIRRLILSTKQHKAKSNDEKLFIDADMSILASSHVEYDSYAKNIRQEYLVFSDETYIPIRIQFIEGLLGRERVFLTEEFKAQEVLARKNLQRELKRLQVHV